MKERMVEQLKTCSKCGRTQAAEKHGRSGWCRACKRVAAREERARTRVVRNAAARQWHRENRERSMERIRRYRRAHPLYRRQERLRRRGAALCGEAAEYAAVLLRDPCSYCGAQAETLDHIDALSEGGKSTVHNLTAACRSCNSSKNRAPLLQWLARR